MHGRMIRLGALILLLLAVFDRCVAATCRTSVGPQAQRVELSTYVFD